MSPRIYVGACQVPQPTRGGLVCVPHRTIKSAAYQSKPGGDFLLLRKRRKEEIYASHSCQHRCGGGPCVVWEPHVCR